MNKSVKKYIIWGLVIAFIAGSIAVGGPFNLIDIIIVRPIVNILFVIFDLVHDFGWAIIIFTVLVKLCMWPLTKRQLNQAKLMRKIQPELTKIRKNCNGNKQMESLQTMDLYKRYNIKPFASILVLLIQLPIFIAIFSAIRVIATPTVTDNLSNRAYSIVAYEGSEIADLEAKQEIYLADLTNDEIPVEERAEYDFHPMLFGGIDLTATASDVISPSKFSWSAVFMLVIAIAAALAQYFVSKQQMPSGKSEKKKKFRELIKEAEAGKELDQADISNMTSGQMSKMMPIMMFIIMINLHGALAFYYFLSNMITILQQKIILGKVEREMDDNTDRAMTRELKKIQEAEIVENKKTGTKVTRISARDAKKRGRASSGKSDARVDADSKKEKK
ncbi:YidC/Oxa1 family membrane protein insertase [Candidatus Saccharibacteria bacterium]|nr:YidC/Oxa1 family membrane protein insertase [Candidatus Saccharibacteria bacterium]